jgi:hypothetical protein
MEDFHSIILRMDLMDEVWSVEKAKKNWEDASPSWKLTMLEARKAKIVRRRLLLTLQLLLLHYPCRALQTLVMISYSTQKHSVKYKR